MGHNICFCTSCRVMLMDPDSVDIRDTEEMRGVAWSYIEGLPFSPETVEADGRLFYIRCPVCHGITVAYRYESHSGGPGA